MSVSNEMYKQTLAESKILLFKLTSIKKHIIKRLTSVDPTMQADLKVILNMIDKYETIPNDWNEELIVQSEEDKINA